MANEILSEVEKARKKKERLQKKLDVYKAQLKEAEENEKLAQQKEVMKAIKASRFSVEEAIELLQRNAKVEQPNEEISNTKK